MSMVLADYLRDSNGTVHRVYPNSSGELVISTVLFDSLWEEPTYTVPTMIADVRELSDSDGTTWYLYATSESELTISQTDPGTVAGIWKDPVYDTRTEEEAATGNEIYLAMKDSDATEWFMYPNSEGELVITQTEPT